MANEDTPEPSLATVGLNASHELHMTTLPVLVTWLAHKCTCVGVASRFGQWKCLLV